MYLGDLVQMLDEGFGVCVVKVNLKGHVFEVPGEDYYHNQYTQVYLWQVEQDFRTRKKTLIIKQ